MNLIIDVNNLCYKVFFRLKHLSIDDGRSTGIIFGFFKQLLKTAMKFKSSETKCFFCFDSKKNFRRREYSNYKNRPKDPEITSELKEVLFPQMKELQCVILPELGFKNIYMIPGYESDDTMCILSKMLSGKNIIMSNDNDMLQCLNENTSTYNGVDLVTDKIFRRNWGIPPGKWGEVKAMAGCTTDTVEGITGVGSKTAIKYLKGTLGKKSKAYTNITSDDGQKIIKRNRKLVVLPFDVKFIKYDRDLKIVDDKLNRDKFIQVFEEYEFVSFLKTFEKWETALDLYSYTPTRKQKNKRRMLKKN